jgi:YHS domain-containing protein
VKALGALVLVLLAGPFWVAGCQPRLPEIQTVVDPVCGAMVPEVDATIVRRYRGQIFYFDKEVCARKFDDEPEKYFLRPASGETDRSWESMDGSRGLRDR